eukprot:gene929-5193_t
MSHCMRASLGLGVLNRGHQHPGSSICATTSARVDQANTKVQQSQTHLACKPQRRQVKVQATPENVDQDKAGNKNKYRSFPRATPIPKEERAAELVAIHKELVTDLWMAPEVASKVMTGAIKERRSVLSLENCRGWITTLRQLGLDDKGVIQGLKWSPRILICSAGGREEANIEVLRVLQQAGLKSAQVMHVLQKYPAVLLVLPAALAQRLDRLASIGSDCGPFLKNPMMINYSNYVIVTCGMHSRIGPRCIILRELGLAEDVDLMYTSTWLTKNDSDFATWPTLVQAYRDVGRERFPTTNSLKDAIVVCHERWNYEWKAKFDALSLMMQAEWKVSGIAGLSTIENQIWKEEE